jgi:hypothetical protein
MVTRAPEGPGQNSTQEASEPGPSEFGYTRRLET